MTPWDAAFAADRPVLSDVHTDPNVPPLPAHISFAEAKGFMETLVKGDPAEPSMVRDSLRAVGAGLVANAQKRPDQQQLVVLAQAEQGDTG